MATNRPRPEDDEIIEEVEGAEDAITDMTARERRRDGNYQTGGDDHDPGINAEIDLNAPKESQVANKPINGSRNRSDWN